MFLFIGILVMNRILCLPKNIAGIQDLNGPELLRNPTGKGGLLWTLSELTWGPVAVQK
jgi:hypothetical protein